MNKLEDFLSLPDVDTIEEEVFVSERLGKFKVKAMSADEHAEYQARCKGKINKKGMDFDTSKFQLLICAGQTLEPNFNNAEFLKKKLKAGEIAELSQKICRISGFETDINEDIQEAKN